MLLLLRPTGASMTQAFLKLDEEFLTRDRADDAGCTAVVAVLDRLDRRLVVGNVGDSRAILSRGRKAHVRACGSVRTRVTPNVSPSC